MDYFQAIILAIVQGITEFLPVSSSAHLILTPRLFGWDDQGLAFDVAVHVGTLFAVIIFLRNEIQQIIPAWLGGFKNQDWNASGRLGWWVLLATIPVGLVGVSASDWIEVNLREPYVIALSMLVFGLLLGLADRGGDRNEKNLLSMTLSHAVLIIGMAQVFALIPGASRSGITMTAALFLGYQRSAAAKFSFLLAVPTIALSGLLKGKELIETTDAVAWGPIILGMVVSAVFALLCMHWFIRIVERLGMQPFVYYRVLLAAFIVVVFYF